MNRPWSTLSDEELVAESCIRRDAFAVLLERYQDRLSRYIRRLGVSRREDGEDILQNVFLKTYRNLNEFDQSLKFSSWIYRIAHNEVMSFFRSTSVRPEGHKIDDADAAFEVLPSHLDTSSEAELGMNARQLAQAMSGLEAKYREVLVLRYFEDREYADISDILRIPMGTVATLLNRAKKKLRESLAYLDQNV